MGNTPSELDVSEVEAHEVDHLIIGAGVCGIFMLRELLELGLDARVLDANAGPGGTWFNNRYPGCRFDSESYTYQYSFSQELLDEWDWSERFASQPEILSYLQHVVDRFDLAEHMDFETRVASMTWREDVWRWEVRTVEGRLYRAKFVLCAMGLLSVPTYPRFAGMDRFQGVATHTFDWPEDLDVTGKRVAVVGTGASGVQVVAAVKDKVEQLTVLQRGANWCAPLGNAPIDAEEMARLRASYDEIFEICRNSPASFMHRPSRIKTTDVTVEERDRRWMEMYHHGHGTRMSQGNFRDAMMDPEVNRELSNFIADRIRERVKDPKVAEMLIPTDHGFGNKRVGGESGFYEAFNQPNVELVSLLETPVHEITETGIRLEVDGGFRDIEVDVIVYATGFDAVTGPFDRIDITGVDGIKLKEKWRDGPETCVGVQVAGFPNLFTLVGPQSGSATANFPRGIEDVVTWMRDLAAHLRAEGIGRMEGRREAEIGWVEHVAEFNAKLLVSKSKSWFNGHNSNLDRDAKPRVMVYLGGAPRYRRRLAEESAQGYPSFVLTREPGECDSGRSVGVEEASA
ncbi:NAD(P)/FAD-dependent oxidoreductase [Nocardioides sp. zg-ZUI104]|uniref:flavin-containing monooxygenase n=1 Tax=Nocardioides faecalis TaxID=2803858 RepID=UPI001BCB0851|nr:NAD(P)/FAD-dependent oxidoreductase [Nocardioides faecalis]MBS4754555.1 NAD(P)/FAD-dependent oxidoreductase [Nocardioides faecalis]